MTDGEISKDVVAVIAEWKGWIELVDHSVAVTGE